MTVRSTGRRLSDAFIPKKQLQNTVSFEEPIINKEFGREEPSSKSKKFKPQVIAGNRRASMSIIQPAQHNAKNQAYFLILVSIMIFLLAGLVFCYTHETGPFGCGPFASKLKSGDCLSNYCRCENGFSNANCRDDLLNSCFKCHDGFTLKEHKNEVKCVKIFQNNTSMINKLLQNSRGDASK